MYRVASTNLTDFARYDLVAQDDQVDATAHGLHLDVVKRFRRRRQRESLAGRV